MSKSDVENDFPALAGKDYGLSDEDFNHNCLAFALGDVNNWWEPPHGHGRYWPPGFSEDVSVKTVEAIIRTHGFTEEISKDTPPETDAVAIFAIGDEWTHFARFSEGAWASKLGEGHDVAGVALDDLVVDAYGTVTKILRRPRQ
jgi:hypothetical protein